MTPGGWARLTDTQTQKQEIRVQYQATETKRWREWRAPFSSEEDALRWADQMFQVGDALAVRIYRETTTIELLYNLVAEGPA